MPDIKFVIFDMDEVLYDYDHRIRLALLADLTGRPAAEIDSAVWGGPHENRAEAGQPDTAEGYLGQFAELLEYPIDFITWAHVRRNMMRARPDVLNVVRQIKKKADVALLTNNGMLLKSALPICAPEIIGIFEEKSHVSAEFKARKPDQIVYQRICERYGYEPKHCAFIDDREENILGAEQAGLTGHTYTSLANFQKFLLEHSLL
jgi:HAD superfamily hydrolase (TIGR01509 family)